MLFLFTSRACLRKVLFSALAQSMHSRHSSTSWPVAASMSRNRSRSERTNRAAFALLMEIRKGLTNFRRPPSSKITCNDNDESQQQSKAFPTECWFQPAACPVLAKRVPNSRMLCSLTRTASSSSSWTSRLTEKSRQSQNTKFSNEGQQPFINSPSLPSI